MIFAKSCHRARDQRANFSAFAAGKLDRFPEEDFSLVGERGGSEFRPAEVYAGI